MTQLHHARFDWRRQCGTAADIYGINAGIIITVRQRTEQAVCIVDQKPTTQGRRRAKTFIALTKRSRPQCCCCCWRSHLDCGGSERLWCMLALPSRLSYLFTVLLHVAGVSCPSLLLTPPSRLPTLKPRLFDAKSITHTHTHTTSRSPVRKYLAIGTGMCGFTETYWGQL